MKSTDFINIKTLSKAIQNSSIKIGPLPMKYEQAQGLADKVLNFFGFGDRIIDNAVIPEERDVFNMLDTWGLLSTSSEELQLYNGKEWRIYYWGLNKKNIFKMAKYEHVELVEEEKEPKNIYDTIPDDVWKKDDKNLECRV